ncbi:MAG: hypothetical protein ABI647_22165 [Gemmatimonadota bacterium]
MSPEQAAGEEVVDRRADIYALGAVLYEMLSGEPPFTGPNTQTVLAPVMTEDPRPLSALRKSVPPHVDAAVSRALEKLPADRFQTAAELGAALASPGTSSRDRVRASGATRGRSAIPWALSAILFVAFVWMALRSGQIAPPVVRPTRFSVELDSGVQPTFTPIVRLSADGRQFAAHCECRAARGDRASLARRDADAADRGRRPAIDLAVADWAGGSLGRNGKLVYTRAYNTGLSIVSEGGGDGRILTTTDSAKSELGHWWPQVLPDGDHVIFTAYHTPIERATIEVLSIKTGKRDVLLTGGVFGFYVPSGHLLFAAGESIRAVPFDLERLAVTRTALLVVDSVAMNPSDGAAAFDVSKNGTLAYLPVSSYVTENDLVLVDRLGTESRATPTADRYQHPRLSPDGGRVAADIRSANSLGDVWVFEVGRPGGIRLTSEGGRDWGAEWTPDGKELIYISERPFFDLYRRVADASRPAEPLLTGGYDRYTGAVSRDGRLLAFELSRPGGAELWTVPLQGEAKATRYFANGFNLAHPAISPDGRWMAYDSDESGQVAVYVQSFPDPGGRRWKASPTTGSEPMWTRGGRELVFRKGDSVMAVTMELRDGQTGQPMMLFSGPYPDDPGWTRPLSYDVSADGERFLLLKRPPERSRPRINVVLNWFEELRAKVPR